MRAIMPAGTRDIVILRYTAQALPHYSGCTVIMTIHFSLALESLVEFDCVGDKNCEDIEITDSTIQMKHST